MNRKLLTLKMFTMHHDLGELIVYNVSLGGWLDLCNLPSFSPVQWTDRPPDRPPVAGIMTEDTPVMQTIISVMFC